MISYINKPQETKVNNTAEIQRLVRAITFSQGQFSLLLACANSNIIQQQAISLLKEFSPVEIKEVSVSPTAETLYTAIATAIDSTQPSALMVVGLDSVIGINQLITSTNLMRDALPKKFHFPLILWINDEILRKLIWLAPDLKDWAACTIRFNNH